MDARERIVIAFVVLGGCASPRPPPAVKVAPFGSTGEPYVELLRGPPETVSMQSGVVALEPGKTVGAHDTEDYEEMVIPLEGRGELRIPGRAPIALAPGVAAYAPPHTPHDIANAGETVFRYVFVAAKAR